jgi:hypothetical protein
MFTQTISRKGISSLLLLFAVPTSLIAEVEFVVATLSYPAAAGGSFLW